MRNLIRVLPILIICVFQHYAHAVPSFSRQTGLACNVCHTNPPELTAFGRNFKLKGYVLTDANKRPDNKIGDTKDLSLTRLIPLSFMIELSDTAFQSQPPAAQNNAAGFPQQLSLFLAGGYASHFGSLVQVTYTHQNDHFGMDQSDLRFANQTKLGGKELDYGININNTPAGEDLWNSTPAWSFPWISSPARPVPTAAPLIAGALGQGVAGVGFYNMWNEHLYSDVTVFRSEQAGAAVPLTGVGASINIANVAPYWRAAWQQDFGDNYLEVGTYGLYLKSHPGSVSGPEDIYSDPAVDLQYERPFGSNLLDAHATYIRENQTLNASFASGGAANLSNHLNNFRLDSTYHWTAKYSATGAYFATTGNADALLYPAAAFSGSNNGSPNSAGYIAQFAYWPVQNIDIDVNYTGYTKFNGASTNYDGAGRNASDNNTFYVGLWLLF